MPEQDNARVVREIFDAWNAHDVERFTKLVDPNAVWESDAFAAAFRGHGGSRQFFQAYVGGFPDLHIDVAQTIASGDHVVVRWRARGTHLGDFAGIKPTNGRLDLRGCTVAEVKAGKLVHGWVYLDNATLLRQLGVLPG